MSTGSESTIKGKFDEVAGKVKQTFGEATNNESIADKGAAQQVKGHAEQAWGSVKSAAADTRREDPTIRQETTADTTTTHTGHDVRDSITSAAKNVKDRIQEGVAHFRAEHDK